MSSRALLVTVHLLGDRYHGAGDWPPAPFRLFQALVAGAYGGRWVSEPTAEKDAAFRWLEGLAPPHVGAPRKRVARATTYFVPNNDLDAVGGDPARVSEIRAAKVVRPTLLTSDSPFVYAWRFADGEDYAKRLCALAERLHTLGRGVDAAFAEAEVCDWDEAQQRLVDHAGSIARPGVSGDPKRDPRCPVPGSLDSLKARQAANAQRFVKVGPRRKAVTQFRPSPWAQFRTVAYDSPGERLLFDIRPTDASRPFLPVRLEDASKVATSVRDLAATRLIVEAPKRAGEIERLIVGREADDADIPRRPRFVPLPSIGTEHTDPSIRRVLVEVPPDSPFSAGDLSWAISGENPVDPETGEVVDEARQFVTTGDDTMLGNYGVGRASLVWYTVTPAALPERAARRRIDPKGGVPKPAAERMAEEGQARVAVVQALRHAGITNSVMDIRVQREPFFGRGARAEAFAPGTRFAKERLWHVEVTFATPVEGPLVMGDGRYLGLGLMAPVPNAWRDVLALPVPREAGISVADGPALVRAVRRALMALAADADGRLAKLFSGHEPDGSPAASGRHEHVFIAAADDDGDGTIDRVVVAAPWACDRSWKGVRTPHFDTVVSSLGTVRAGRLGVIALGPSSGLDDGDVLLGPARVWESRTRYLATRHAGRGKDRTAAVVADVIAECRRRSLPRPEVEVLDLSPVAGGGGLSATLRLRFATAVAGPILLGRDSHQGGGVFAALAR